MEPKIADLIYTIPPIMSVDDVSNQAAVRIADNVVVEVAIQKIMIYIM